MGVAKGTGPGAGTARWGMITVAVVLTAAVAVGLHTAAGASLLGSGHGPLRQTWPVVVGIPVVAGLVLLARPRRGGPDPFGREPRLRRLSALLLPGVVLVAAAGATAAAFLGPKHTSEFYLPPGPMSRYTPHHQRLSGSGPGHGQPPWLVWTLVVLAAAAVFVPLVLLLVRLERRRAARPAPVGTGDQGRAEREALAEAVRRGRLALTDSEARAAIIACYAAMEGSLAAAGYAPRASDAPEDLLRRAAPLLGGTAAPELTALFRESRYSSHPLGQPQLDRARAALAEIADRLAAPGAAPADAARKATV